MEALRPHWEPLLDRAHRAGLHRMSGVCQLLGNLCQIGPCDGMNARVPAWMEEFQSLSAAQHRLWLCHRQPNMESLLADVVPELLLAAAMRFGTPGEAGAALPAIEEPQAALGLALWLENVAGHCPQLTHSMRKMQDGRLRVRVQAAGIRLPTDAKLFNPFGQWLELEADLEGLYGCDAGVLVRGLSLGPQEQPAASVPRRAAKS